MSRALPEFGSRGARLYERLSRREAERHLLALDHKNAETAWTSNIAASRPVIEELLRKPRPAQRRRLDERRFLRDRSSFRYVAATVALKDNIVTPDLPTSCASNILREHRPPYMATLVEHLKNHGLILLGKTNMDEFGMGSHSRHSAFGPVQNARDAALSAGGSSGGSALLVAAGLAHYAIGTDTGGSVRLPAAYVNIVGFKPSYGRISRYGVVPYANSLDTVGLFALSVADLIPLFSILDHPDPKDPTCLDLNSRDRCRRKLADDSQRPQPAGPMSSTKRSIYRPPTLRIGVPLQYNIAEMQNGVREAWLRALNLLMAKGHEIVPISLPSTQQALSAYYVLAPAEASSNLAKYDGVRYGIPRDDTASSAEETLYSAHRNTYFGEEVKRRILLGAYSLSAGAMDNFFIQAQRVRRMVQNDFNRVFRRPHGLLDGTTYNPEGVDYIVCPTAPTFPPKVDALSKASPLEAYTNDVFTVPASLAGLPAISVPAPQSPDSLAPKPERAVGIQVIGQYGDDHHLLQFVLNYLEKTQDWSRFNEKTRRPIR